MDSETKIARLHTILRKTMILLRNGFANGRWSRDEIARRCSELIVDLDRAMADPAPKLSAFREWNDRTAPKNQCATDGITRREGWNGCVEFLLKQIDGLSLSETLTVMALRGMIRSSMEPDDA